MLNGNDMLENFAYKLLAKNVKKFSEAVFVDEKPIKVVMSDTLQNELVHLGECFFHVIIPKMAFQMFVDPLTKE